MVTGIDIVREQLRIAGGEAALGRARTTSRSRGHAIEVRINAECPEPRLRCPRPARIDRWAAPRGHRRARRHRLLPGLDDRAVLRLAAGQGDRRAATTATHALRAHCGRALRHLRVEGVATTAGFALDVLEHPDVVAGRVHTRWVEEEFLPELDPDARRRPDGAHRVSSTRRCATASRALWGMRMRAGHILPVADAIDSAGYRVVDLTGSSMFEVLVRFRQEDPWQGLDAVRAAMPNIDPARGHAHQRRRRHGRHAGLDRRALGPARSPSTASTASGSSTACTTSTT